MLEMLLVVIVAIWAVRKAAEWASGHWQAAKAANRRSTRGQPLRQRAASAARHDTAYWAQQVRGGFPQVRHGLYMGWHAGRIAQLEGWEARAQARADHANVRARVTEAVREQRRRQDEALERIRAAARQPEPEPEEQKTPGASRSDDEPGVLQSSAARTLPQAADSTPSTEGNAMPSSGDTTYTQQMRELQEIRRDAEAEVNSVSRKRMQSRLDILQSLDLDKDTLSEAAAIDDALQAQEKAAQQTLDAADAAISGLQKRHGGIQEAVDSSPVDKPAQPEFYTD